MQNTSPLLLLDSAEALGCQSNVRLLEKFLKSPSWALYVSYCGQAFPGPALARDHTLSSAGLDLGQMTQYGHRSLFLPPILCRSNLCQLLASEHPLSSPSGDGCISHSTWPCIKSPPARKAKKGVLTKEMHPQFYPFPPRNMPVALSLPCRL